MKTFKNGDKVTHPLHGKGKVDRVLSTAKLVEVRFDETEDLSSFVTAVHPVSLTKIEDGPRIVSDITVTTVTRTIEIEGGPRLNAGPEFRAGIDFIVDKVTITTTGDAVVSGYRFRDGQLNKSYLHSLRYPEGSYPGWLWKLLL